MYDWNYTCTLVYLTEYIATIPNSAIIDTTQWRNKSKTDRFACSRMVRPPRSLLIQLTCIRIDFSYNEWLKLQPKLLLYAILNYRHQQYETLHWNMDWISLVFIWSVRGRKAITPSVIAKLNVSIIYKKLHTFYWKALKRDIWNFIFYKYITITLLYCDVSHLNIAWLDQ